MKIVNNKSKLPRLYAWQGYDCNQQFQHKEIAANSLSEAKAKLLEIHCVPIKIKFVKRLLTHHFKAETLIIMTRQLATLLHAGLPLSQAIRLLSEQNSSASWRYVFNDINQNLAQGISFSETLKQHPYAFSPFYQEMIATGELTGRLEYCCEQLTLQQEKSLELQKKVKKALRYPLFLLITSLIVTIVMLTVVLPKFTAIYRNFDAQLPIFTQMMINVSFFLQDNVIVISILFLLLFLLIRNLHKSRYYYAIQYQLLNMPVFGSLLKYKCLTQIFQTLATTQSSGISLTSGLLSAQRTVQHICYQELLDKIIEGIEKGTPLSQMIQNELLLPPICYQLIQIGEESGALDLMLEKLASYYQQQTQESADNIASQIEPLMMSVLAIIIGSLIIAMYLPIFYLGNILH